MNNEPKATTPIEIHVRPNRAERRRRAAIAKKRARDTAKLLGRIGEPEVEIETDGRFLADFPKVPGAMAYGATAVDAVKKARAIAIKATAPRHTTIAQKRRWAKVGIVSERGER